MTMNSSFERTGKIEKCAGLMILFLALIWLIALYAYATLPEVIPTHFGVDGKPDSFGGKETWIILPIAFSIAPVLILLIVRYRFEIIEKHPYLVNLPAFLIHLSRLPGERKYYWIDRYFEILSCFGAILTAYLLIIEYAIYLGDKTGKLPVWFSPFIFVAIPILLIYFLVQLRALSKSFKEEVGLNK